MLLSMSAFQYKLSDKRMDGVNESVLVSVTSCVMVGPSVGVGTGIRVSVCVLVWVGGGDSVRVTVGVGGGVMVAVVVMD